jgi:hypothetical protein
MIERGAILIRPASILRAVFFKGFYSKLKAPAQDSHLFTQVKRPFTQMHLHKFFQIKKIVIYWQYIPG